MIYTIRLEIPDLLVMDFCEIDVPEDEAHNVEDAFKGELMYNDFDAEI